VTPASFEPVIDYVVTKIPRWAFEKLPGATAELGTRMQSVGEVMAIGRNFAESLQKAVRSLEQGRAGFALGRHSEFVDVDLERLWHSSVVATPSGCSRCTNCSGAARRSRTSFIAPASTAGSSSS